MPPRPSSRVTDQSPMCRPPDGSVVIGAGAAGGSSGGPCGGPSTAIVGGSLAEYGDRSTGVLKPLDFWAFWPDNAPAANVPAISVQNYSGGIPICRIHRDRRPSRPRRRAAAWTRGQRLFSVI